MPGSLSLIIPCWNEMESLPALFSRIEAVSDEWPDDYEILCVDDGSSDGTVELLRQQHERDPKWKVVILSRNFGHQSAVSAGLAESRGEVVAVIDADLQDPPELISRLIEKWREGFEVVYAVRKKRKEGLLKRTAYFWFYRLMKATTDIKDFPLDSGDFSLLDRKVVETLVAFPEKNRFLRGLRAWSGFRQTGVEYERSARHAGEPKYGFRKLLSLAGDGLFSFSGVPLRLASFAGLFVSLFAGLGAAIFVIQRIYPEPFLEMGMPIVPGFAATIVTILFLGGVQLLFLGVIGEYLNRIYTEVKGRPEYIVAEKIGLEDKRS
ncbi:MAG: glycosyltransferase family 2 protein [Akkermansiaceae bacterium]